jgi:hypothetical protein
VEQAGLTVEEHRGHAIGDLAQREVGGGQKDAEGTSQSGRLGGHEHPHHRGSREALQHLRLAGDHPPGRVEPRLVHGSGDDRIHFPQQGQLYGSLQCPRRHPAGGGLGPVPAAYGFERGELGCETVRTQDQDLLPGILGKEHGQGLGHNFRPYAPGISQRDGYLAHGPGYIRMSM